MIEHGQRRPSRQIADLLAGCLRIPEAERDEFLSRARATSHPAAPEFGHPVLVSNLPTQLTALIGRDKEARILHDLLLRDDVHLLTLTGPPGIGKTRLAIEVAASFARDDRSRAFKDGIFWVPLASVTDPEIVPTAIARSLDLPDKASLSPTDTIKQHLRQKSVLLVLDNFEQVVAAAPLIPTLLAACPSLKALVTSREALSVYGEQQFSVPPLEVPRTGLGPRARDDAGRTTDDGRDNMSDQLKTQNSKRKSPSILAPQSSLLSTFPAVQLFVERAQAVDRTFALTPERAPVVAAICAHLDGLPLAIELVSVRTGMLPVEALLERLQDTHGQGHLDLLSSGPRDLPHRQKTLRGAISWSYDLLSSDEQVLFRRLGVFRGGFTLGAAEAICNARSDLPFDSFEGISQLLHKNLLKREIEQADNEPRYSMLETIREYAMERLEESGEARQIRLLHAEYLLALASAVDSVFIGEHQRETLNRLDRDYANLRAALAWTLDRGPANITTQLGISLARYWELRGYFGEGRDWLLRILALPQVTSDGRSADDSQPFLTRVRLLTYAARLSQYVADYDASRKLLEEGLSIAREHRFKKEIGSVCMNLGNHAYYQGDLATAQPFYQECLEINKELGNRANVANSLWMLGSVAGEQGDLERAEALLNQSLALGREMGDIAVTYGSLRDLAMTLNYGGEHERAVPLVEEGLALARRAELRVGVGWATAAMGFAVMGQGDYARAQTLFRESLALAREQDKVRVADCLEGLVQAEMETAPTASDGSKASFRRAARLLGATDSIRRALNTKISPVRAPVRERLVTHVRALLEDAEYEQAHAVGLAMSLEETLDHALDY
jgi:predicted ATPase